MTDKIDDTDHIANELMEQVGLRVRRARTAKSLSRRELSEIANVSPRYIAQMEAGQGNISIVLLSRVATALEIGIEWLLWPEDPWFTPVKDLVDRYRAADRQTRERVQRILAEQDAPDAKASRICLIGLRGAGKSTLGKLAAETLGIPFIELNQVIQDIGGMPISEIMALYGPDGYRQFEADALNQIKDTHASAIVAAAGGVVGETASFDVILTHFNSIWRPQANTWNVFWPKAIPALWRASPKQWHSWKKSWPAVNLPMPNPIMSWTPANAVWTHRTKIF